MVEFNRRIAILTALIMVMMPHHISQAEAYSHRPKSDGGPSWAKTMARGRERTTKLQFYFHDVVTGENATVVQVAPPGRTNGSCAPFTGFGFIRMVDDPLTVGHDPKSELVGRAQGLYGRDSQEEYSLLMALTFTFLDGIYNGSSFSVLGRNSVSELVREMPVIGGTGLFRMARGYALARTYFLDVTTRNAIVGYNVTLVH